MNTGTLSGGRWKKTEIGDKVSFVPHCMIDSGGCFMRNKPADQQQMVTGEVVYINRENHWYRVRYAMPGVKDPQYECFLLPVLDMPPRSIS